MSFFGIRKGLTSYRSPLTRIVICVGIWVLMFFRNDLIALFNPRNIETISKILTGLYFVMIFPGITFFYISVIELRIVYQNKRQKTKRGSSVTLIDIDRITKLVAENDIVEVELLVNGKKLLVGASSDCAPTGNKFFDKLYYIDSANFESIEDFKRQLLNKLGTHKCSVVAIDGCNPKHSKL